jgi:cation diffusion facilitator CzcD-associated flavoprotein CzcO
LTPWLRHFLAEKAFSRIDVFEQRSNVGGVWNYTPETSGDGFSSVPQTDPHIGMEKPVWRDFPKDMSGSNVSNTRKEAAFLSPIYEHLETNIPKPLMGFSDIPFADEFQLFPTHNNVQQYLEEYATDVRSLIHFQTQIIDVRLHKVSLLEGDTTEELWSVKSLHLLTGEINTNIYGAVVVASGHYSTPFVPDIPGLREWNEKFPVSISHSKYYRTPEAFRNKKVIVVGNSASGLDISSQLVSFCEPPLLLSQKSESYLVGGFAQNPNIESVPHISHFDVEDGTIHFSNGRIEHNVDCIVFCTGYLYTMPFLQTLRPNPIGDGSRIENTYLHMLYAPHPTLSFLVLPQKIIPFPLSQAQSAVLARVLSGRLGLPSENDMKSWEEDTISSRGDGGDFHTLKFPKDAEYINMLYDWAVSAPPRDGLEHDGRGKLAKRWGEWEYWARENFPAIRKAFVQRGEERKRVTSLKELGFNFENRQVNGAIPAVKSQPIEQVTGA